ncbi:hypothetical protein F2Q69_00050398 [Brassica cretica]|uniref:Uncharacterized protein n=1 Tax=Brassica cretica TaxID=69181 RepID=A0A8S9PYX5_BRACR|nr:hypothetical protein F2Q69_00050398 [Brassica cretica]
MHFTNRQLSLSPADSAVETSSLTSSRRAVDFYPEIASSFTPSGLGKSEDESE